MTLSALLTIIYSLRLIYFVFFEKFFFEYNNIFYKTIFYKTKESNIFLIIPLILLSFGSIISGYYLQDIFVGQGSEFFRYSLYILPKNELYTQVEHAPSFFKILPFFFSFLGFFMLLTFFFFLNSKQNFFFFKDVYRIFIFKLYFDEIYNIISIRYFFPIGFSLMHCIDNGFLEIYGPRGLLTIFLKTSLIFNLLLDKFLYNYIQVYIFFL